MIARNNRHNILKMYYCKSFNTIELPPPPTFRIKKTKHKKENTKKKKKKNTLRCFSKTAYVTCILKHVRVKEEHPV